MNEHNPPHESQMISPPTDGALMEESSSTWPTVVGVIGIAFSSLTLLCSCPGFFAVPLQRWGADMQAQAGQANPVAEAQVTVAEQFQVYTVSLLAIGLIVAVVLMFGSIGMVKRRRKSRNTMMVWAMASLFLLMINVAFQILMIQATRAELARVGESGREGELMVGVAITTMFTIVFGLVYQIFVLVWLSRKKIIAEVETWR